MIELKFKGLKKVKAVVPLKQGYKGGYKPPNAVNGSNGSYYVVEQPAKLYLYVEFPNGEEMALDIINYARAIANRRNITEKFVADLAASIRAKGSVIKYDESTTKLYLEEFF